MSSCTEACKSQHHCHHNHHQNQDDSHNHHDHDADDQPDQGCRRVCEHVTVGQVEFLALPQKSSTSPGCDGGGGVGDGGGGGDDDGDDDGGGDGDHIVSSEESIPDDFHIFHILWWKQSNFWLWVQNASLITAQTQPLIRLTLI